MDYFDVIRALVSLAVTLGLLVIAAHAWKRWGSGLKLPSPGASRLTLIESKRLSPHTTLHLVKLDDTEHLLSVNAQQTTLLQTLSHKKK